MITYIDSSAVLRVLFNHKDAYARFGKWGEAGSSELLRVECNRTLYRLRLEGKISDETLSDYQEVFSDFIKTINIIELNAAVLERSAGPFQTIVGSLDAIHLSTALLWKDERQEDVVMLTHDAQLAVAARAAGLMVAGVQ